MSKQQKPRVAVTNSGIQEDVTPTWDNVQMPEPVAQPRSSLLTTPPQDTRAVTNNVLVNLDNHQVEVSRELAGYYDRNRSLFERIFPTKLDRVLRDNQLNQARTQGEFHNRLLKLTCDAQLEASRETLEDWLKYVKTGYRASFAAYVSERLQWLESTLETHRLWFNDHFARRFESLESCKGVPQVYRAYGKSLEEDVNETYEFVSNLLRQFRQVITERFNAYDRSELPGQR